MMQGRRLKTIRVGVSLLFFLSVILLFLDFRNWYAPDVSTLVLYPQFIPSLLSFLHGSLITASGFIVVLGLTIMAGRVYCSSICPLGTLQDVIIHLSQKKINRLAQYRLPQTFLRYSILVLTFLAFIGGSSLLLNFFDPFSSFGRIITNIFRPVGIVINNSGAMVLEKFGVYTLVREHWAAMAPFSIAVALAGLLILLWLSVFHGRLYCNAICPVGTLLGVVSRFSFLKLQLDENTCTNCRRCTRACKADCIDLANTAIDMSRCVSCYNCLAACKTNSINFERRWLPLTEKERRMLIRKEDCLCSIPVCLFWH